MLNIIVGLNCIHLVTVPDVAVAAMTTIASSSGIIIEWKHKTVRSHCGCCRGASSHMVAWWGCMRATIAYFQPAGNISCRSATGQLSRHVAQLGVWGLEE